jgi:fibronectin-binding autotransporter adhesin
LDGGGIFIAASATAIVNQSTIANNIASDDGAGINNEGGVLTVTHSTISGNNSGGGSGNRGGGIIVYQNGTVNVSYSTITNNQSGDGGGITIANSAGTGTVNIEATIVWGNRDVNGTATVQDNCSFIAGGTVNDINYNLSATGTGCGFSNNAVTTNPVLGALASNGGFNQTHAIAVDSSAANVIPQGTLGCAINNPDGTGLMDQRTAARAGQNSAGGDYGGGLLCDIGAFEFNATAECGGGACNPTAVTMNNIATSQTTMPITMAVVIFLLLGTATAVRLRQPARQR